MYLFFDASLGTCVLEKEYAPIDGHRSEDVSRSNQHVQCGRVTQGQDRTDEPAAFMMTKWKLFGK